MAEYTISAADVPESSNFSLAPGEEDFKDDFSSTPRSLLGQSGERDRANISPIASGNTAQTYSIIVAVAEDVENGGRLAGVEGDIILVFNELNARTAGSVTVITDARKYFEAATVNGLPKALPPSLHSIRTEVDKMGRTLRHGDTCFVYLAGHVERDPSNHALYIPLPNGERLYGKDLALWLGWAASGGGTVITIADICHSIGFLDMPIAYNLDEKGSLTWRRTDGLEMRSGRGPVIVLGATKLDQLALTISVPQTCYAGQHGLFTWHLFNYLRRKPLQVDTADLIKTLYDKCVDRRVEPHIQVTGTIDGLVRLPLGRLTTESLYNLSYSS